MSIVQQECRATNFETTDPLDTLHAENHAPVQAVREKSREDRIQAIFDELMEEFRPAWNKLANI